MLILSYFFHVPNRSSYLIIIRYFYGNLNTDRKLPSINQSQLQTIVRMWSFFFCDQHPRIALGFRENPGHHVLPSGPTSTCISFQQMTYHNHIYKNSLMLSIYSHCSNFSISYMSLQGWFAQIETKVHTTLHLIDLPSQAEASSFSHPMHSDKCLPVVFLHPISFTRSLR